MTTFILFVIGLTFLYVVYYTVIITLDLNKKKAVQKSDEEIFDISDMDQQEEPTPVNELVNNESNGLITYTDGFTEDGLRLISPSGNLPQESDKPHYEGQNSPNNSDNEELNEEHSESMEAVDEHAQVSLLSDELFNYLNNKHKHSMKKRNIEKTNAIDHL